MLVLHDVDSHCLCVNTVMLQLYMHVQVLFMRVLYEFVSLIKVYLCKICPHAHLHVQH